MKWCDKFFVRGTKRNRQLLWLFLQDLQKLPQKLVPKTSRRDQWEMFAKIVLREQLSWFADSIGMTLLAVFILLQFTTFFSEFVFPHCMQLFWNYFVTHNLCKFWRSKFQQVSTYAFRSRDDIFTQKWSCSSPDSLCKCTKSRSTLSTNTSLEWKLY